ncbi:MAG: ribose-phosphate pyrophosphokinase [Candidatus Anoxymicrobium japonicum]|uniref:Ribose-phosphate pyrophosphokinase n=1 Tax=Candidatus Anoxymicrobium japonicum TaxID=2013648 RepID=A0A2N3G5W9_9ACTN|nr:MAG: ribose-phosphate pyrophosphokinase [Candidatus Anoxymicrobium japonicum]
MMVFAGTSHRELGEEVAAGIGVTLGNVDTSKFANGEIYVRFLDSVRGVDAFVIQTCSKPINDNIMELLLMIDALKRASAKRITAVMPYYGYSRQDKKTQSREPISAHLIADVLTAAGANRVLSVDLHAGQIQGFFDFPLDHITAMPLLTSYFIQKNLKDVVVVSPDAGRVKVAKRMSDVLHKPMAIMNKERPGKNKAEILHVIGEVNDRTAILIDDMVDTAGTMVKAADALKKHGAKEIYACATHPILSGPAIERIERSEIKELVVTNTLPVPPKNKIDKITVLSIAPLLANTITAVFKEESVSEIAGADNQT